MAAAAPRTGPSSARGSPSPAWTIHLVPWETEAIDVSDLDPGTYVFEARTEGGKPFVDTRTIVIE